MSGSAVPRIVVEVSNLSIHRTKFVRTGIQEVIYQTLIHLVRLRASLAGRVEIQLLPYLPKKFSTRQNAALGLAPLTMPYEKNPPWILREIEKLLELSSKEVWGFDLKATDHSMTDDQIYEVLASADHVHYQSMVNIGPMLDTLAHQNALPKNVSMTFYDLIPVLFPEYCHDSLTTWFGTDFLESAAKYVKQAICISRHTALDLLEHPLTRKIPQILTLPLPFELPPVGQSKNGLHSGLKAHEYIVFLGSLEPRKNFDGLLEGFEKYRELNPDSPLKLVMVGSTGWKNEAIERRLKQSIAANHIVRTGYLSDADLSQTIRQAAAVAMLSFYEGYGLPVAQALSLGVPAITTLGSSLPEACRSKAIFVEPLDPLSVAAGLGQAQQKMIQLDPVPPGWTWDQYSRELLKTVSAVGI